MVSGVVRAKKLLIITGRCAALYWSSGTWRSSTVKFADLANSRSATPMRSRSGCCAGRVGFADRHGLVVELMERRNWRNRRRAVPEQCDVGNRRAVDQLEQGLLDLRLVERSEAPVHPEHPPGPGLHLADMDEE